MELDAPPSVKVVPKVVTGDVSQSSTSKTKQTNTQVENEEKSFTKDKSQKKKVVDAGNWKEKKVLLRDKQAERFDPDFARLPSSSEPFFHPFNFFRLSARISPYVLQPFCFTNSNNASTLLFSTNSPALSTPYSGHAPTSRTNCLRFANSLSCCNATLEHHPISQYGFIKLGFKFSKSNE